jgi:serine/threonine-protein kinase
MIGKDVAHYRATVRLGAGGMGEVYRATDSRLGREVALKVLRDELTKDADGLARFEREARLLAGLQHSNIAVIHGMEESDGVRALVMELVEGHSLAERIQRGALALDEALPLARQVADALEYAHERGIIHRDLKPANVMVTPDGQVKILDFGLAKALGVEPTGDAARTSDSGQTLTVAQSSETVKGMIMGTAAYMSPEQARGKTVDRRTDIWAFGCVVYEMLAGRRAFTGDTVTDTLATVLQGEPDWNGLPATTPASLAQLVRRCLDKDAKRRLQAMGEARVLLEELAQTSATGRFVSAIDSGRILETPGARRSRGWWPLVAAAGAGLLVGGLAATFAGGRSAARPAPTWLSLDLAPAEKLSDRRPRFTSIALSPDGRTIAFTGVQSGKASLYLRSLDRADAVPVAGSDDAQSPFFSPDGRFVGFVVGSELKKVTADGGPVTTLADLGATGRDGSAGGDIFGASWEGERIVVGRFQDGLFEVSASGGAPRRLTKVGQAFAHRLPHVLPNGAILFTRARTQAGDSDVAVLTPKGDERILVESAADGRYLPTGQLVFFREGVLEAAPFDLDGLRLKGTASPVLEDVMQAVGSGAPARNSGAAQLAWSRAGTLVLARGGPQPLSHARPVFVDRSGQGTELALRDGYYSRPRISPDGGRIAVTHTSEGRRERTRIWVVDAARGTMSPLPREGFAGPVWSPDGQHLVFRGLSPAGLYRARADGASEPELLLPATGNVQTGSIAPDASVLAYVTTAGETGLDIWLLPLTGEAKPRPWLQTSANENHPEISPDGRFIAYASDVSGRYEVYVQPFPGPEGARHQVSLSGGQWPRWSRDGHELFFLTDARPRRLLAAAVSSTPAFSTATPREVLPAGAELPGAGGYDVAPDGRFLMLRDQDAPDPGVDGLQVVLDGFALLTKGTAKN